MLAVHERGRTRPTLRYGDSPSGTQASWHRQRLLRDLALEGLAGMDDDAAYRAMDFLLDEVTERSFFSMGNLLDLEFDLIFVGTTSTYFETEQADPAAEVGSVGT